MSSLAGEWRLLGFDARETPADCIASPIPDDVREELLLRSEIECPFSVDRHIWPSHFLYHPEVRQLLQPSQRYTLIEADPDCHGGLWPNLARMRQKLRDNVRDAIVIAIEFLITPDCSTHDFPWELINAQLDPVSLPETTVQLGFDVAAVGPSWSALSNCGYLVEERQALRPLWKHRINDFGLLKSQADATEFKAMADNRVPGHGPFCIYQLYRLPFDLTSPGV